MKLPKQFTTTTKLSKTLAMIIFVLLPFVGFWTGIEYQKQKDMVRVPCTDRELGIEELPSEIKNSTAALKLIRQDCYVVVSHDFFDVTNDGKKDLLLNLAGLGCGSCHTRLLAVIDWNERLLFYKIYDQANAAARFVNLNTGGFKIRHSFKTESNSFLDGQENVDTYTFDTGRKYFNLVDSSIETQDYYKK